jgi:peptidoglycan/xylan/chitin deacetylase (PgdA/CDA1 family)/uncharacterized membrane protein YbhN (UPF0104 family)
MGKRQVLTRFVALSVVWVVASAILARQFDGIAQEAIGAVALLLNLTVAWGSFAPNARVFGRVVGAGEVAPGRAAITFDDGPSAEHTPAVLDILREHGVRATFFVLGRHVRAHPDIARRIVAEGHELATHGEDHALLTFAGPRHVAAQLRDSSDAIEAATGSPPAPLFRTPHGYRSPFVVRVARELGYRVVGWSGSVWDTAKPGVDRIVARSSAVLRPGAILLLHDADGSGARDDRSQTVAALPGILAAARDRGLELVTVGELSRDLRPHRRMALRAALVAVAVAGGVVLAARRFDLTVLGRVFTDADPALVMAAVAANFVSVGAKALTWKAAIDAVPAHRERPVQARLSEVVPAIFIGFLLNTILFARLGEIARVSVLRRKLEARGENVPVPTLVGTLVSEQLVSGVTLVAVLLGITAFVSVPGWALDLLLVLIGVLAFIALAAGSLEVYARLRRRRDEPADAYVERWWHLLGIRLTSLGTGLREGQALFGRPRLAAWAALTAAGSWMAQIAGIDWALHAYGIEGGLSAAGLVFLASTLVGLFPIVPGNLVVFQASTAAVLTFGFGVPEGTAITFSIGLQLIEAVLGVGAGFFFLSYEGLSIAELRTEAEGRAAEAVEADGGPAPPPTAPAPPAAGQGAGRAP